MKNPLFSAVFILAAVVLGVPALPAARSPLPGAGTGGTSPHATTSQVVVPNRANGSMITVTYGRPFATHPRTGAKRAVWGELVPWGKAWRLGADEATLLINPHTLVIGSTTIAPGAYTIYMVPEKMGTSKLAFSRNIGKWGVPVDEGSDVARVDLKMDPLMERAEQLTIEIENTSPKAMMGTLRIKWENTQFSVPFTVKK